MTTENHRTSYNFICIEGNIGAGKTSLASKIAEQFNAKLILEQFEDNPFLPKFYNDQDKYAFPLELSFLASRYQQLIDQLAPQDLFKTFTISDYLIDKSLIFAKNTLHEDEYNLYAKLFNIMMGALPRPDLLVYLYVNVERLQGNIRKRGRSYEQQIEDNYLERIQAGYLEHLRLLQNQRILIIDTNNLDFINNEGDYKLVLDCIFSNYTPGIHRIVIEKDSQK